MTSLKQSEQSLELLDGVIVQNLCETFKMPKSAPKTGGLKNEASEIQIIAIFASGKLLENTRNSMLAQTTSAVDV